MKSFFQNRYDASHAAGTAKLLDGTISLFSGVSEVLKNDVIVAVTLKELGGDRLQQLLERLRWLEGKNLKFFLAERDFVFHSTVQVATGGHDAVQKLRSGRNYVKDSALPFNRLVIDAGGNIILMNEGVPRVVSEWRGWASQVMTEHGGVPKPLPIFHATVARLMSYNHTYAAQLISCVESWNKELQEHQLLCVADHTFVGTTYVLLTT